MKLFICKKCGNLIELLEGENEHIICCGEKVSKINVNDSEASGEKHLPVINVLSDDKIEVLVGLVSHPMSSEHNISFIMIKNDTESIKKYLKPEDEPKAIFPYLKNSTVYAYCNLHGLFKTEVK